MNPNDQLHFYSILDLTAFPLKLRNLKVPVSEANEQVLRVGELQRPLAIAPTDTDTLCGENHTFLDSASTLTSAMAFSANSRSPPLSNRLLLSA